MPIRITGMNSGLDTESIISELVKAQKTKVDSVKKKQTSLQWKQDSWKDLNSKLYKLFNSTLSNMRFSTDYSKKTTSVSDSAIASVITSDSAMNSSQELYVTQLATSGFMTGGQLNSSYTKTTKLSDMGIETGSSFSVTTGGKTTDIAVTEGMTIQSLVTKMQEAGIEANFDEKNHRFYIGAKSSGKDNDFVITASNDKGTDALTKLKILSYDANTMKAYEAYTTMTGAEKNAAISTEVSKRLAAYVSQRTELTKTKDLQAAKLDNLKNSYRQEFGDTADLEVDSTDVGKQTLQDKINALKTEIQNTDGALTDDEVQERKDKLALYEKQMAQVDGYRTAKNEMAATQASLDAIAPYIDDASGTPAASALLTQNVTDELNRKIATANAVMANAGMDTGVNRVTGTNAIIKLNGVTYESDKNTFDINGLTITALAKSDKAVTLTTNQDTDGIYNMIKGFLKEYNALINEMDKLYNAEAAKGYEPLTDDEKKEMSDSEVEKWEEKIKNSILRRDSNLSSVSSALKDIMLSGAEVNGQKMYLSNFGIGTLGYFSVEENERNAYHIDGDVDDDSTKNNADVLKAAIATDPDKVISFFSQLSNNLYQKMSNLSSSIEGVRSFGTFYDDKRMKEEYNNYTTKIKQQEQRLTAMEDKWYSKFSAMETALAKLQSNQSAVSSLLGGS